MAFRVQGHDRRLSVDDVLWLKREGVLSPGANRRITWSRHGEVVASISVRAELGRVILTYRHRSGGDEWKDENYPVYLATTPCHMGGERHWFLCPAHGCGQRVAVILAGASSLAVSATSLPILRSVKTPGIEPHGGRIAYVTAWDGLGAFWKGQPAARPSTSSAHWFRLLPDSSAASAALR